MADFGDFKESTPAPAETYSMPARDPSLDDFEKLENFCIQDKAESEIIIPAFGHDLMSSGRPAEKPTAKTFDSLENTPTHAKHEGAMKSKQQEEEDEDEEEDKDKFNTSASGGDPFADLMEYTSRGTPHVTSSSSASLLDFEMPMAPAPEPVTSSSRSSNLPVEEEDDFEQGFRGMEKLVQPAPSDSGYGPSPSDAKAVDDSPVDEPPRLDKIVPSAPEITSHVSTADSSLVTGQQPPPPRRSPSPVEIPRETSASKADTPSSTPTYSPKKMSTDEVSSTKEATAGCPFSPSALFDPKRLNPCVTQLVYWQEPKKSGLVFGSLLFLLLSLRFFSLISVVSYLALAALTFTLSFRIYKNILQAVQKANDGHPFKEYLEFDLNLPQDKVHETADTLVKHLNCTLHKLRSLFLVEDLVDSIKLGIVLWSLTYLGAWFNGLTLIILGLIATFTFPKIYESNQTLIDQYLSLAGAQVSGVLNVVKSKIPFGKKEKSQ